MERYYHNSTIRQSASSSSLTQIPQSVFCSSAIRLSSTEASAKGWVGWGGGGGGGGEGDEQELLNQVCLLPYTFSIKNWSGQKLIKGA